MESGTVKETNIMQTMPASISTWRKQQLPAIIRRMERELRQQRTRRKKHKRKF